MLLSDIWSRSSLWITALPERWCRQNSRSCTEDSPPIYRLIKVTFVASVGFLPLDYILFIYIYIWPCLSDSDICDPKWRLKCPSSFRVFLTYYGSFLFPWSMYCCIACLGYTDCSGLCACLPVICCWHWIVWCMHVSCIDSDVHSRFELWSAWASLVGLGTI